MLASCLANVLLQQSAWLIVLHKVFLLVSTWVFFSSNSLCLNSLSSDNYVHRLVASKTDGKIVQYECEGDMCQEEKIDALQLEVNIWACRTLHCTAVGKRFQSRYSDRTITSAYAADLLPACRQSSSGRSRMFLLLLFILFFLILPGSAEPMQLSISWLQLHPVFNAD